MSRSSGRRGVFALTLLLSLGALGAALVSQHVFDLQPCPWCVLQRVIFALLALAAVLALMGPALHSPVLAVAFVGLLGVAGFATVPPLQMWVLRQADGAGETLASSFNIAAFNLGNALGAGVGGAVIAHGPGLPAVTWVAALLPLAGAALAWRATRPVDAAPRAPGATREVA